MERVDILYDALSTAQHNLCCYGGEEAKPEYAEEWQWEKEVEELLKQMIAAEGEEKEKSVVNPLSISVVFTPELNFNKGGIKWYPDRVKAVDHGN